MKKLLTGLLFVSGYVQAQRIPPDGFDKIRITDDKKIIQADLKKSEVLPDLDDKKWYYWAAANSIHATQGGFSGRLLNGNYTEYYLNKSLKVKGAFKTGLKSDVWKAWTDNGQLQESYVWRAGYKTGAFYLYDEQGKLKQSGHYRNDLLEGTVKTMDNGTVTSIYYHQGHISQPFSLAFWRHIHLFKKKTILPKNNGN